MVKRTDREDLTEMAGIPAISVSADTGFLPAQLQDYE